ncbi:hypothetical protein MGYG_06117 [Nannizzia gypsea CBS 118893]|uniref:Restriction of telomere capping protein 4 n=1 Tax=Arthroderma gypseum (strain ATCC MYA-4604 / CBS 118893) TaxID=535722 RepID=E4V0I5_ARTGP|nr:hypothetical protein MGYG_06117 [Nannizzia gypsea CBS 118893]EFR03122.1 hypothetical protein MGYG_06117 [Nannizzia gypsea CBS 118893]
MASASRPNPSFASTRLTTRNHSGGPPLTQVGGRPTRSAQKRAAETESQSPDDSTEQLSHASTKRKAEPATDDEPLASSDEDEYDDFGEVEEVSPIRDPQKRTLFSPRDLNYHIQQSDATKYLSKGRLEGRDSSEIKNSPGRRKVAPTPKKKQINTSRKPVVKRNIRKPATHPSQKDKDEEPIFAAFPNQVRKQKQYSSKASHNIHASTPLKKQTARELEMESSSDSDDGPEQSHKSQTDKGPRFKDPTSFMEAHVAIPASSCHENDFDMLELSDGFEAVSPLSSVSSSFSVHIPPEIQEEIDRRTAAVTVCPVCEVPVDVELFKSFKSMERMGQQSRFCLLHRRKSAEKQWKECCYPTIDWGSFQERIESHFAELERMLLPDSVSVYRELLKSSAQECNKQGNFRLSITNSELEKMTTGYYGARGAKNMMEAIVTRFAPRVRELALSDSLVKAVGVSGYVQAVLVPELTTTLVKEDMNVDEEEARRIMQESMEIGDLLNPQIDDTMELRNESLGI